MTEVRTTGYPPSPGVFAPQAPATSATTPPPPPAQAFAAPAPSGDPFAQPAPGGGNGDLSAFDADYAEAEVPSYDEVPDGKYQVRVDRAVLGTSQAGDPMLKWDLVIISGEHAGRHIFKNAVITQKSLPFVKGDLFTLGVELPKFSELPNHLPRLLDQSLEVTKRTKGDYSNVYFNRRLEALESGPFANPHADDIPF